MIFAGVAVIDYFRKHISAPTNVLFKKTLSFSASNTSNSRLQQTPTPTANDIIPVFFHIHTVTMWWLECHLSILNIWQLDIFILPREPNLYFATLTENKLIQFAALARSLHASHQRNRGEKTTRGLMHSPASQTSVFCCLTQLIEAVKGNKQTEKKKPGNSIFPIDSWPRCVFPFSHWVNLPQPPLALGRCCLCNFVQLCACAFGVFSPPCLCWTTTRTGNRSLKPPR